MRARRLTLALAIVFAAALAVAVVRWATAPSDAERVRGVVERFVTATNARDAAALCDQVLSLRFLEAHTGARGERARSLCRRDIASLQDTRLRLVAIEAVRVDGDRAVARARIAYGSVVRRQRLFFRRDDGQWRIDGGSPL